MTRHWNEKMYVPLKLILSSLFALGPLSLLISVALTSADDHYNVGAFAVGPQSSREILQQSTGFPLQHYDYIVQNVGKAAIWVELKYGTLAMWHGTVVANTVQPGETKYFSNLGSKYYVTALKLHNNADYDRAVLVAIMVKGSTTTSLQNQHVPESNFDINEFAKFYYATVTDNIPFVGATISHCIEYFWPDTEKDVWDEVKDRVSGLIDSKISATIENLLKSNVRRLKKKVKTLDRAIKKGITGINITDYFMAVAHDLIGIEEAFRFTNSNDNDAKKFNYVVLPLYSTIITMKLLFYRTGIKSKEQLGLDDAKISLLQFYAEEMLEDHNFEHITRVYEERMNYEYQTCQPENLFNALATVKTFTAVNGLESIPMWEQWIREPFSNNTPYCDTVTISKSIGSLTSDLLMEATGGKIGEKLVPPLIQKQIHGKPVQVRQRLLFIVIKYDDYLIRAISTYFENIVFHMGDFNSKSDTIDLKKRYVKKIVAFGNKIIAGLSFTLSDGTTKHYGSINMSRNTTFQRDGHHICGIFVGQDTKMETTVIGTMAVSYVMDHKYDFM